MAAKSEQHIKVVVRVRPLSQKEVSHNAANILTCNNNEINVKGKTFRFDTIFSETSSQMDVYSKIISPMIEDVIHGYNCTVFVYGSTGAGKTYTMTGGKSSTDVNWKTDPLAGCIPRACLNIFDRINSSGSDPDYSVKVSYLELYNEELRDLLNDTSFPLTIYNDPQTKGAISIMGLKEITVYNRNDIYRLLEKGMAKKMMASTGLNANSSRSHTVFTITVYSRQPGSDEDVIRTGKLNLVDLAGSESVNRAGTSSRKHEVANINKSLLTLGRVIQALVEKKNSYIPYRDSKLTRILQDSLGGKTKTCIIATVSPASTSAEDTLCTLDYAFRARDITNSPQANETTTKGKVIKMLTDSIAKCKRDLNALMSKNGIYVGEETYETLMFDLKGGKDQILTKQRLVKVLNENITELMQIMEETNKRWDQLKEDFKNKRHVLHAAKKQHKSKSKALKKEKRITSAMQKHSAELGNDAKTLLAANEKYSYNRELLMGKINTYRAISSRHEKFATTTLSEIAQLLKRFDRTTADFINSYCTMIKDVYSHNDTLYKYLTVTEVKFQDTGVNLMERHKKSIDYYTLETSAKSLTVNLEVTLNSCNSEISDCLEYFRKKSADGLKAMKDELPIIKSSLSAELVKYKNHMSQSGLKCFKTTNNTLNNMSSVLTDLKSKVNSYANDQKIKQSKINSQFDGVVQDAENAQNKINAFFTKVQRAKDYLNDGRKLYQDSLAQNVQLNNKLLNTLDSFYGNQQIKHKELVGTIDKTQDELVNFKDTYIDHLKLICDTAKFVEEKAKGSTENEDYILKQLEDIRNTFRFFVDHSNNFNNLYSTKMKNADIFIEKMFLYINNAHEEIIERGLNAIKAIKPNGDTPSHGQSSQGYKPLPKTSLLELLEQSTETDENKENIS